MAPRNNTTTVVVNIYDLSHVNNYTHAFGLGAFHSGIEVYGTEYSFGRHENDSSGIFSCEPRAAPGCIYRETIEVGPTSMSLSEVKTLIEGMGREYPGTSYDILTRNCNSFGDDLCVRLTGSHMPYYVNRLANYGSMFSCFMPGWLTNRFNPPPGSGSSSPSSSSSTAAARNNFSAFTGSGNVLSASNSMNSSNCVNSSSSNDGDRDNLRARLARAAQERLASPSSTTTTTT